MLSIDVPWPECIPKYVLEANLSTGTMIQVQDDRQQAAESSGASRSVSVVSTMNVTRTTLIVTTSRGNHGLTVHFGQDTTATTLGSIKSTHLGSYVPYKGQTESFHPPIILRS